MKRFQLAFLAIPAVFAAFTGAPRPADAQHDPNSCILVGGMRAPAILEVHDETPSGTAGITLWSGTIARDQRIPIRSGDGRIRYQYRYRPGDAWNADVGAWCRNGSSVTVP